MLGLGSHLHNTAAKLSMLRQQPQKKTGIGRKPIPVFFADFLRPEEALFLLQVWHYPFTAPAVISLSMYRWKRRATSTGGMAARMPPAIMPFTFTT